MTYGIRIQVFFPDYHEVEKMVAEHGVNLFYDSIEYRRLCCHIRKLEPLKRAFQCGFADCGTNNRLPVQEISW